MVKCNSRCKPIILHVSAFQAPLTDCVYVWWCEKGKQNKYSYSTATTELEWTTVILGRQLDKRRQKTLMPMIVVPIDFGEDLKADVLAVNLIGLS